MNWNRNGENMFEIEKDLKERILVLDGAMGTVLQKYEDNPSALREAGLAYAIEQVVDLVASDINGIHLYTMNRPETAKKIIDATGIIRK